ncbi:MAG: velvet factor-domain-containing protein [Benjaminiella poitrasii]|nr:MAG: velvet factor-domain-containing protein [Benjaminiella poitrasii]
MDNTNNDYQDHEKSTAKRTNPEAQQYHQHVSSYFNQYDNPELFDFITNFYPTTTINSSSILPTDIVASSSYKESIDESLLYAEQQGKEVPQIPLLLNTALDMTQFMGDTYNHTLSQSQSHLQNPVSLFNNNTKDFHINSNNTIDTSILNSNEMSKHKDLQDSDMMSMMNAADTNQYLFHQQTPHHENNNDIPISFNSPYPSINLINAGQQERREQDVFDELISLATNSRGAPHRTDVSWQQNNSALNQFFSSFNDLTVKPVTAATAAVNSERENAPEYLNSSETDLNVSENKTKRSSNVARESASKFQSVMDNNDDRIHELEMVQQPLRARMCGNGAKDRRPISPPPILKLTVKKETGEIVSPEALNISFLVVMCDFCQESGPTQSEQTVNSKRQQIDTFSEVVSFPLSAFDAEGNQNYPVFRLRSLVGSLVSSAIKLYDTEGNLGIYFIFQDICLRTEGVFRLKFSLIDIGSAYSQTVNTSTVSRVLKVVESEPFTVYTAKKFPGVVQSTSLSKCFALQGIKIPIHRENSISSKKRLMLSSDNEVDKRDEEK